MNHIIIPMNQLSFIKKRNIVACIIIFEFVMFGGLGIFLYRKIQERRNVLGTTTVVKIDKLSIFSPKGVTLSYYYELIPHSVDKVTVPWTNKTIENHINGDGIPSEVEYSNDKDKGTFRIIMLGDSFTYGLFVEEKKNYSTLLQDLLNQKLKCNSITMFEVINLGIAGYDIQNSVERFRLHGIKYHPDLVIWLLKNDDFEEIREIVYKKATEIYNQLSESEKKEDGGPWGPISMARAMKEFNNTYAQQEIIDQQTRFYKDILRYYSGSLLLFTFPTTKPEYRSLMSTIFTKVRPDISYFEGSDIYAQNGGFPDTHPNERGHELIAQDLFNFLYSYLSLVCQ